MYFRINDLVSRWRPSRPLNKEVFGQIHIDVIVEIFITSTHYYDSYVSILFGSCKNHVLY